MHVLYIKEKRGYACLKRFCQCNFWLIGVEHARKIHWTCLEKFCRAKERQNLDFRISSFFSQALLAEQAWQIL